ncbi:MAG: SDR family oxidoreductase [Alphaproteobacteria bacterium]|nr:SDR family oxidoreductase [Alphaproteobacteria bacterium]
MPGSNLEGKVAFVTGASTGLGWQIALTLARAGARVAITARRSERLEALAGEIEGFDGRALPVTMDARDPDSIRAAVGVAETELGPIDVLVNNAGIAIQKLAQDFTDADYRDQMGTNLDGYWFCAQAVGKRMIQRGQGGKIINIASLLALRPIPQLVLYAMSKAAVTQMTRALALEWARHDIQVNAICPGYIETEMNRPHWRTEAGRNFMRKFPRRRVGMPEVLDGTILLLASAASDFITGAIIPVDDGQSLM